MRNVIEAMSQDRKQERDEYFLAQVAHLKQTQSQLFVWSVSNLSDKIIAEKMREIIDKRMSEFSKLFD